MYCLCAFVVFALSACGGSETAEQFAAMAAAPVNASPIDDAEPSDADDAQSEALASARPNENAV